MQRFFAILLISSSLLKISSLHAAPGASDAPVITTDPCGGSVLTAISGTSTEAAGSIIKVYLKASAFDAKVEIGSTVVRSDGSWTLTGVSVTSGILSATARASGETESALSTEVELAVPPVISQGVLSNPTICGTLNGAVELLGFLPFTTYDLSYTDESGFQSVSLTADALGAITISGLGDGELQEITATLNGCVSNTICSIELEEPSIPTFTLGVPVQPVSCGGSGSILITGAPLQALDYQVSYYNGSSTVGPTTITSSALGIITITGLGAGTYSNFQVSRNGCNAGLILDRITLYDGLLPSTVVLGTVTQPTTCTATDGSIVLGGLLVNTTYEVFYENADGLTVSTNLSTPVAGTTISITGLGEGIYRNLRVKHLGCISTPLSAVNLSSLPTISVGSFLSPLSCASANGSIVLDGLVAGNSYQVGYKLDGVNNLSTSLTADSGGKLTLSGLASASYSDVFVTDGTCQSNVLEDIISLDEIPIPEISLGTTNLPSACGLSDGSIQLLGLTPGTTYDLVYKNSAGVQTTTTLSDVAGIFTVVGLGSDQYSDIKVSLNGCSSNTLVCEVDLDIIPSLSLGVVTPEVTCGSGDGSITLLGLDASTNYDISYKNSSGVSTSLLAQTSTVAGTITISGLGADTYSDMTVTLGGCSSESLADISLGGQLAISKGTVTSPSTCGGTDGSIVLAGLSNSTTYDVSYVNSSGSQTVSLGSDGTGLLTLPNLGAGNYSSISVSNGGCQSNTLLDAITLTEPSVPSISLGATVNPTSCVSADGSILLGGLLANTAYSASYTASGAVTTQNITTNNLGVLTIAGLAAEDYQNISVSLGGCKSNTLTGITSLVDVGTPSISLGSIVNPSVCGVADGSISLSGLAISTSYNVSYTYDGVATTKSISSNGSGELEIPSLEAGFYENIKVSVGSCLSASVGPVTLECDTESIYTINNQTIDVLGNNSVLASATDADGTIVCAGLKSGTLPAGVSLNLENGSIYVSNSTLIALGSNTVSIETVDEKGGATTQNVTFEILNDTPDANNDSYSVNEGATITVSDEDGSGGNAAIYGVIVNDTDVANSGLTVTKLTDPANHNGTFTLNSNGTFVYTHDGTETTSDSFTYRLTDGSLTDDATVSITIDAVNDAPVAVADAYTFDEGSSNTVVVADGVLDNDTDAENNSLSSVLVSDVSNGTLTLNANGSFTYAHDGSETTSDSFTYKVNDGTVDGNTVTVSITIDAVNDAPVAVADAYTFDEGSSNTVVVADGVLDNDTDAENNTLSSVLVSDVSNGTLTLNANGSFTYAHDGSETTSDSFTYKVNDGTVDGNTVTVSITIDAVNDAPVAVADAYTFDEGSSNTVVVADGVLDNDTDAENNTLSSVLVSDVSNGTLTLNANGSFTYAHDGSETTSDSFTYKVNDGTVDGNTVTVSITIDAVNDAPVAVADAYTFDEGSSNTVVVADGVLDNDTDAENNSLSSVLVSDVSNGTLTLNANGSFTYAHDGTETTSDSFTYKVNDGTVDGNTVTVSITIDAVNDAPVAVADAYTFDEGSSNTVVVADGVLDNDTDAENNSLSSVLVSDVSNGTLTLNANGSFTYAHDGSETTSDSFTYKVNDGTVDGNTVTVSITIDAVNDAPVAVADAYTFDEGSSNTVVVADGVLDNDTDAENNSLSSVLVSDVSNGTLTLNANGSFTYAHDGTETTSDSFTYKVNDGTVDGNTVTVSITIDAVNDAPVAVADAYTFDEGSSNTVVVADGVLDNDTDAENNSLSSVLVSDVSNGTLTLNANGSFTYAHDGTETTSDSFTYKVNDGTVDGNTVTVSITIDAVNDAPVAVADAYTFDEGSSNTVVVADGVLDNDTDAENNTLSSVLVSDVSNGTLTLNANGSFTYAHDGSETTSDSFTYKVNDGTVDGNTVTVSITIDAVNDAPVAVADAYTFDEGSSNTVVVADGVLDNDTDAENNTLSSVLVSDVSNGTLTLNANGSFTYAHDGSETTSDSFTYKVNDGTVDGNTVTVSITITPQNDAPVAVADAYTFDEGSSNTVVVADGVLDNDTDAENNTLSSVLVSDVSNGTLSLNANGSFTYAHDGSETTSDSFTYKVNDGTVDGNTVTVSITITPQNDAPVAVADAYTFDEGSSNTVVVADGVLDNDTDAENNTLSSVLVSDVSNGTLSLNANGSFTYAHDGSETTSDSFTYKVNDGTVDGNTVTVSITITPQNDAPVAVADAYTFDEGSSNTVVVADGVLDNDTDAENNTLSSVLVSDVSNGTLTLNANGSFTYAHDGSETTSDSFTYKVNDGTVDGNTVTVSITITPQNDAPVAVADAYTFDEGSSNTVVVADGVLDNDTDAENNTLSSVLVSDVSNGTLTLNANGSFTYAHDGTETTSDSFTYKVNDGTVDGNTVTVSITITPQNDAPVAVADAYTFDEGSSNTVVVADGVLDNDTDAENNTLSSVLVSDVSNGTLSLNANGSFTYAHDGSETTSDSFTYKVNDGTVDGNTVTVSITITPQNDAPVAVADAYTFDEGSSNTVVVADGVLDNDTDAENNTLSSILVTDVSNGTLTLNANGSFTYAHDGSETTSDSFTYKVNDGTVDGNTVTVSLTITPVNDAPVAVADAYTFDEGSSNTVVEADGVLDNDTDAENSTLSSVLVSDVSNGTLTLNANGSFTYAHDGSETTSDSFTYKVNDGTVDGNTVTVSITITPQNDAPVAVADAYTFDEGSSNTVVVADGVLDNDTDAENNTLSSILVTDVSNGTLTLNANGSFTYAHDGSETTSDSFTYKVNDGTVDGNTVTVSLTITPVNDAPIAVADAYTFDEGSSNTVLVADGVLDNDTDAENNTLSSILVTDVSNGTLALNANGSFTYAHDGSETTSDSFTYKVNDGTVDGNTVTVSITITPQNDAPIAVADAYTFDEGSSNTVVVADGVLDNDTDAENNTLSSILVTDVSNGTLTLNANGSFTYAHDGSETTSDSFTYKVNDGTVDGNTVTVSITIDAVNDAPVAVADAYTFDEGSSNTVVEADGVLDNDTDAENNTLSSILVTDVSNGTLTLNANGSFTYAHDGSETTSDSFTYKVNDGTVDGNTVTVSITITPQNDAPVAADDAATVDEGAIVSIDVVSNDSDSDGTLDLSSIVIVSNPANGMLTDNGDGTISYAHDDSDTTDDSFTYSINDNEGATSNAATVTITINPIDDGSNTAPLAEDDAATVDEGAIVSIDVVSNDSDSDGTLDLSSIVIVSNPANGTLTDNGDGTISYAHDDSDTTDDSFTYSINDNEGATSNAATVTITINPIDDGSNTAPLAADDAATVDEGAIVSIDVVSNDSDSDGTLDLSSIVIVSNPANGTLTDNGDGTISYAHDDSDTTDDSFTYTINDNEGATSNAATVTITINPIDDGSNTAPVAVDDAATVDEGATVSINVVSNDTDSDGTLDLSSIVLVSNPANGTLTDNGDGTISYEHDDSNTTDDSFTYTINDNEGATSNVATVTITINPIDDTPNTAPLAADDAATVDEGATVSINVVSNDTDSDGTLDFSSIVIVGNPVNGMLTDNGDGTISYEHDDSNTTDDSFTYTINDNEGVTSNAATVTITINPIDDGSNTAPLAADDAATVDEGATVSINVVSNDKDSDGTLDLSSIVLVSNPANGTLTDNGDGTISYAHDDSDTTDDSFTYTINDNEGATSNAATVTITINPIDDGSNTAPVAVDDAATVDEGATVSINVVSNDTDSDGTLDLSSIVLVSNPANGTLTDNGDGTISYEHDDSNTTDDSFTYTINDNEGATSNVATVTITINPIDDTPNTAPLAADDAATVDEGATVSINVVSNDTDSDGTLDFSSIVIVGNPVNGMLTDNGDGTISYEHDDSDTTDDSFTYTINDNEGATSNVATVTITINPIDDGSNAAPVAADDAATVDEGATVSINVVSNDSDSDGTLDLSSIVIVSNPVNGMLTDNGDGTISYAHDDSDTTDDSFTYTIDDNEGATSNVATVTITINPIDDGSNAAPVAADDAATVDEGATVSINVVSNDSDSDGTLDLSSIVIVSNPVNGMLTDNGDGTISYAHDDSDTTDDSFTYTIDDNESATSNVATVTITINPIDDGSNAAPVAADDAATVDEGATVSINVVSNDTDSDGTLDLSSIVLVSNPANGTLTDNDDGTISYAHDDSDTTDDSFTYTINDNEGATSNAATVTITINPIDDGSNTAPLAADDAATVDEGATVSINVVSNDTDSDGTLDLSSIVLVSNPANGTLTDNGDGTISYEHDDSDTTDDSFTYTINDNEGATSNVATVIITINATIEVPDAYTPNGDGINDEWIIPDIENYPNNIVRVFNRWGNKVIEISGYNNRDKVWYSQSDGVLTIGSGQVPDGTYFYMIQLEDGAEPISGFIVVNR